MVGRSVAQRIKKQVEAGFLIQGRTSRVFGEKLIKTEGTEALRCKVCRQMISGFFEKLWLEKRPRPARDEHEPGFSSRNFGR